VENVKKKKRVKYFGTSGDRILADEALLDTRSTYGTAVDMSTRTE